MHDLNAFIDGVENVISAHATGEPGGYRRNQSAGGPATAYGVADAIHLLYSINRMPRLTSERQALIARIQAFQDPETGLFPGDGHHFIHGMAFCAGALELLDTGLLFPPKGMAPFATRDGVRELMESIDWITNPWGGSHRGSGIYGAMVLSGAAPAGWQEWYFEWLEENQDTGTGLWRRGALPGQATGSAPIFHHLVGTFHYLFNYDYARRRLNHANRLVDTCLSLHEEGQLPEMGVGGEGWNEIDFLYLVRSLIKRTPHRADEMQHLLHNIGGKFAGYLARVDMSDGAYDDLHSLFATVSALAVVQEGVPGLVKTDRPLRLVLDRKPFL